MAKKFGFFNSINGDRKYLASDLSQAFDIGITTGLKQEEGNLEVVPYQGMQVQIQPGSAMIHGHFFVNDEPEIITLDVADPELNRIDRIVLRYDAYAREINTAVIKGTPAVAPVPPARLETKEQFDLVLADIYIPAGAVEINQSNITDMRDSELCGYIGVKGAVSQLEFDRHLAESVSYVLTITRELSIGGVQSVVLPFKAKTLIGYAFLNNGQSECIGFWTENGRQRVAAKEYDGNIVGGARFISLNTTTIDTANGTIQNVTDAGFEIKWELVGYPRGNATIYILALTHGGA